MNRINNRFFNQAGERSKEKGLEVIDMNNIEFILVLGDSLPVGKGADENIAAYRKSMAVSESVLQRDPNHVRANNLFAAAADRVATNLIELAKSAVADENLDLAKQLWQETAPIVKRDIEIGQKLVALQPEDTINQAILEAAKANYGIFLFESGSYNEALKVQLESVKTFRENAEKDADNFEQKMLYASVEYVLGATYSRLGDIAKSEQTFQHALQLFDELVKHDEQNFDNFQKRCEAKFAYADELLRRGEIENARKIYEKAYLETEKAAHEKDFADGESLRGIYLEQLGNCDLATAKKENKPARESIEKALSNYRQTAEIWTKSGARSILGIGQNFKLPVLQRKIIRTQELLDKTTE